MDKKLVTKMIESNELQSLDDVMNDIFENHLKPSKIGLDAYNKFRTYKTRYQSGKLGGKGLEDFLTFFGYQTKYILVEKLNNKTDTNNNSKSDNDNAQ